MVGAGDPADFGGRPPRSRLARRAGQRARRSARPVARAIGVGDRRDLGRGSRWTDERLAAERARVLRRLGRWAEAAEAWQTAAAAGGGLGAIAWIEVAKLREHRLGGPGRGARRDAGGMAAAGADAARWAARTRGSRRTSVRRGATADRSASGVAAARRADGPAPATTLGGSAAAGRVIRREHGGESGTPSSPGPSHDSDAAAAPNRGRHRRRRRPPERRIEARGEHARRGTCRRRRSGRRTRSIGIAVQRRALASTAIVVGLDRHAALRAVGDQQRVARGGGSASELASVACPARSRPADADEVGARDERRRRRAARCVTRLAGREHAEQALPAEGDPSASAAGRRPTRRAAPPATGANSQPASRARPTAAPAARSDPRPAASAGCGRPASRR